MKKYVITVGLVVALLATFGLVNAGFGSNDGVPEGNKANYVDLNNDDICDNWVDEDNDGINDNCNQGTGLNKNNQNQNCAGECSSTCGNYQRMGRGNGGCRGSCIN